MAFADVLGQTHACQQLRHAMQQDALAHSWIFAGPEGVGKRLTALALVQGLLCQSPSHQTDGLPDSCGRCRSCRHLASWAHPDLHFVQPTSDKTQIVVEQIRAACQFLAMTAMEGRWKVVVIDDALAMNESAASALLKTLEEPSPQSLLILLTTTPGRLLATIRSRCQMLRFAPLSPPILTSLLERQTSVALEVRQQAAQLAEGSMARAITLCQPELVQMRDELMADLTTIANQPLALLCSMAENWSERERFQQTLLLLRSWLRSNWHDHPVTRHWIAYSLWLEQINRTAAIYNLNRQLTLESVFIRLQRLLILQQQRTVAMSGQ
ncbi:MAG: DNA polymerase III subunit delta' [Magnetococcales bacterium]|nr:DNA polymerase III subunit delta' [Magnetococcales bacterium]